jgi:glycosyltransferase involved in cell wall biosynthesis
MVIRNLELLRIAINAQILETGVMGGIEQFIIGLVSALGKLEGPEEYCIVVHRSNRDWLNPYLGPNQRLVLSARSRFEFAKQCLGPFRLLAGKLWGQAQSLLRPAPRIQIPSSDGFYESLGVNVVHFTYPGFPKCNLPIVYNPHDLQHLHYPQFFDSRDIALRDFFQSAGCRAAQAVVTPSCWARQDIIHQYGIPPQKIFAVLYGATTELYGAITPQLLKSVTSKFKLPPKFALYPAQTWKHKNHLLLLEAIALLRKRDHLMVSLVCTGQKNDFWREIENQINKLQLQSQVQFLGYVSPTDLRALYRLAQFVILPSLFEGGGLPVLEAFHENVPVACANVTSLPEYAGDAAILFDPLNVDSIAIAVSRMANDASLRDTLRQRGSERIRLFTWARTAKTYRAVYRQVAGAILSDEDRALLIDSGGSP